MRTSTRPHQQRANGSWRFSWAGLRPQNSTTPPPSALQFFLQRQASSESLFSAPMHFALIAALTITSQASDITVIEARRSGVNVKDSQSVVQFVAAELVKAGFRAEAMFKGVPSCQGKKPCLLAFGKKLKVPVLVTVESVAVLEDATVRIEAMSIEEDGKRLGVTTHNGVLSNREGIALRVRELIPGLEKVVTMQKPEEPVKPPVVAPVVVAPVVKPVEPPVVITEPQPTEKTPFFTNQRVAGAVVGVTGVALLAAGAAFGFEALREDKAIDTACGGAANRGTCMNEEATRAYSRAKLNEGLGIGLAAGGGAAVVTGVILFLTGGARSSGPTVAFSASANRVDAMVSVPLP